MQRKLIPIDSKPIFTVTEEPDGKLTLHLDKSINFVAVSTDGEEYEATYIGPIDAWNRNSSHAFALFDMVGRPYLVAVDPRGGVAVELGTKRIFIVEYE